MSRRTRGAFDRGRRTRGGSQYHALNIAAVVTTSSCQGSRDDHSGPCDHIYLRLKRRAVAISQAHAMFFTVMR